MSITTTTTGNTRNRNLWGSKTILSALVIITASIAILLGWYSYVKGINAEFEVIKIGVILPLTGETSSFGNPMKKGIEFAINKLDSNKYKFIILDSQDKKNMAVSALQKLINVDKVSYVIGDVGSSTTLAIVPIATQRRVFLFSPCAQSPNLSNISPYFARCYPSTVEESLSAARFVYSQYANKQISIVHVNDAYGSALSDKFKEEYLRLGGEIVINESFESQQKDFRAILVKLKNASPDVIYLAGNQKEMGMFMRQYGEYGINAQIISNIAFLEKDCLEVAGATANNTIVPVTYYNPEDSQFGGAYNFGVMFKEETGNLPTIAEAIGFDVVNILIDSLTKKQTDGPLAVASHIRELKNYDGASGMLNFTNGDVSVPIVFKRVENGKVIDLDIIK